MNTGPGLLTAFKKSMLPNVTGERLHTHELSHLAANRLSVSFSGHEQMQKVSHYIENCTNHVVIEVSLVNTAYTMYFIPM